MSNKEQFTKRVVVVSGPKGFNPAAAIFSAGVELEEDDVFVAIERPGIVNVNVEIVEHEDA